MKKQLLTLATLAILGLSNLVNAQAPNWLWAKSAGGTALDEGKSIATDASGNVFMTGTFESSAITFGTTTLINAGQQDIFIVKYDATGNVLWAKSAGGTFSDQVRGVAADLSGNVFVTGLFSSPAITFGTITLTNAGGYDIFIVKYDGSGNVLWAKREGGTDVFSIDNGSSVSTDASGNVFMAGFFTSDTITFGTTTLTNAGGADIFIVKYDAIGNVLWAKSSVGVGSAYGYSVSADASGNVFMTGEFNSAILIFGTDTITFVGASTSIFIVKYDAGGNLLWAKSEGGYDYDRGYRVSADASGNVFMTGEFASPSITFGTTTLTNAGDYDIFIVKYDAGGNVLWAKSAGGTDYDRGNCVSTDASGNVFMTGWFQSSALTFGSTTLNNANAGFKDIFIVKYDAGGNALWAIREGGTAGDYGTYISTDVSGNVFIGGAFYDSTITFGTTTLTNGGYGDIYIAKLDTAMTTGISEMNDYPTLIITPNPFTSQTTISFKAEQKNTTIKILNVLGKEIKVINFTGRQLNLEKGEMQPGIYFVQVTDENKNVFNRKIVIQ